MSFINYKVTGWGWPGFTIATGGNNLTGVIEISAGYFHSLALFHNGTITGWGLNINGQLNDNNLTGVTGISAGYNYSLAVLNNGRVTGWGINGFGVATGGNDLTGVKKALASKYNSLALLDNGRVTGWGYTSFGFTSGAKDLTGVVDIAISNPTPTSSYDWALALLNNGTISGWGFNDGNNNLTGGNNITGVSGIEIGYAHTIALLNNGIVTGWGADAGGGESTGNRSNVKQIQAGYLNNLALLNNKRITGWGTASDGRDWNVTSNLRNVEKISYSYLHGLALIPYSSSSSSSYNDGEFEYNTGLFSFDNIEIVNKKINPVFDTGIYNYVSGQININEYINKYLNVPVSGHNYSKLVGYKILNDISFIPLKSYVGHIYTGLYSGKEPIEYETGVYGIPKVTGEIVLGQINYIDYKAKSYRYNSNDPYYQKFLPESGEKHILLLDLNFYGFEEDSIEDCDIELNSLILRTGFFKNIPKNPSILNLEILDLKQPIGITDDLDQYRSQKRVLQNFKATNFINYDSSYHLDNSSEPNIKYKFLKNQITIAPPLISNNKNIALPCLFQYKSPNNNEAYNIGEYQFLVFKDNNYLQSGNYITGTQTGFLYFLSPGTYTTILSGNENDFLYSENSLSGKNQNIHLLSMDVNFVTGEKLQEIYIENQDKIWATYFMGPAELVSGSGFNSLNYQEPIAFAIDFERNLSGQIDSPFLYYREISGIYENLCTPKIIILGIGEGCTTTFCLICEEAAKLYKQGQTFIDIPKKYLPIENYAAVFTFYEDPDANTYRVAIDEAFILQCCACKENGCQNLAQSVQYNLDNPTLSQSGDKIYSGVFFLDNLNPATVNTKYNINYYSGQIAVNSFYEGDKITFKQYTFDFEKVYTNLYGTRPAIKEYTTEFIFSNSLIGNNYFSGKQDLINKINYKFASSGLYSWKPLKYNKTPEFEYGPLLTGIDAGIDSSGNNLIDIVSLRSGKFGSHDIKLVLQPRLQIYNYLVPKIIKLEISDDFINWTGVVTSENRQPINTYIKSPNALVTTIPYDQIENTKYTVTKIIPTSSETENLVEEEEENLEDLVNKFASGNLLSGSYICILDPTGSGINCGSGYKDYLISSKIDFNCKEKGPPELPDTGATGQNALEETQKSEDSQTLTQEVDRFRIGFYDYLS
jgi:hypothetical protein